MTSLSDKPTSSTPQADDDKEWNEAALAELVGLEKQSRAEKAGSVSLVDDGNIISQGDLFDAPAENPLESKTERTLAKKPLPKLVFVAAGLFVVFGIGGFAISSMMSSKKPKFTNPLTNKTDAKTSIVEKKVDESNESGELKTQLAISKQEDDLKAIDERSKDKKKEKRVKPGDKDKEETPGKNQKAATPVKASPAVANPPTARSYTSQPVRPTPVPARPAPVARPTPVPASPPPRVASSLPPPPPSTLAPHPLNQQPIKPSDPVEQWNTLAMLGSYGRVTQPEDEPNADMGNADMGKLQPPSAKDKQKSSGRTMH